MGLIGLTLSMILPGCAATTLDAGPAPVVAVKVENRPPAELLACAERPEGFPADEAAWAVVPAPIRAAMIRFATAFAANAARLDRLADWHAPGSCSPAN